MQAKKEMLLQAAAFHPSSFLYRDQEALGAMLLEKMTADSASGNVLLLEGDGADTALYYRYLPWDSQYFDIPTYRLELLASALSRRGALDEYCGLLQSLASSVKSTHDRFYAFAEVPSEAVDAMQALCLSGWRLVETRLTYCNDSLQQFGYPHRFPVREATLDDVGNLREIAAIARNNFDRFHADCFFSTEVADNFLATFVENSIKGFADVTLVPALDNNEPGAFLTGNFLPQSSLSAKKMAKMVLSAVGEKRRGWYVKLISEMSYLFKEKGIDVCYMTTQSTNKAVIRTWEKLGYSYGKSSHIFAFVADEGQR